MNYQNLPDGFSIIQPADPESLAKYFKLRYETLRKPWDQPPGSETDTSDSASVHALLLDHNKAVAVCRLLYTSATEAQIRSMGVDEAYRGRGFGSAIIQYLESIAEEKGVNRIILHARENAIPFYIKQGYELGEKSYLLFDTIQHYLMEKRLMH